MYSEFISIKRLSGAKVKQRNHRWVSESNALSMLKNACITLTYWGKNVCLLFFSYEPIVEYETKTYNTTKGGQMQVTEMLIIPLPIRRHIDKQQIGCYGIMKN